MITFTLGDSKDRAFQAFVVKQGLLCPGVMLTIHIGRIPSRGFVIAPAIYLHLSFAVQTGDLLAPERRLCRAQTPHLP